MVEHPLVDALVPAAGEEQVRRRRRAPCASAWVNGVPAGVGTTRRVAVGWRSASSASPHGSGRITMPGPPPYGVSSTVRCTSWVHCRRSCTATSSCPVGPGPADQATDRSGARYSGKIVTMSTRITGLRSNRPSGGVSTTRPPATSTVGTIGGHERDQPRPAVGQPTTSRSLAGTVVDPDHLADRLAVRPTAPAARPAGSRGTRPGSSGGSTSPAVHQQQTPRRRSATSRSATPSNDEQPAALRCARIPRWSADRPPPGRCRRPTRRRNARPVSRCVRRRRPRRGRRAARMIRPTTRCVRQRISTRRRCRPGRPGHRST